MQPTQAGTIRQSLEEAKKQAENIPGGDLSIQDQEELIAILEAEVAKRKRVEGEPTNTQSNSNRLAE